MMRAISVIMGVLFVGVGIYSLINMKAAFISLAFVLGLVMIAYGIGQIISWFSARKEKAMSAWVLGEGVLTLLIGALVCFYPFQTDFIIAIWFAAWLTVSGIMRVVGAIQTKKNYPGSPWGFMLFMGAITIIVGIYAMVHPLVAGMAIAILLGVIFILQGINCFVFGVSLPGMNKNKSE